MNTEATTVMGFFGYEDTREGKAKLTMDALSNSRLASQLAILTVLNDLTGTGAITVVVLAEVLGYGNDID